MLVTIASAQEASGCVDGESARSDAAQFAEAGEVPPRIAIPFRAIETTKPEPDAKAQARRAQDDLEAQQAMAKWAFWVVVASFAQAIIGFLGLVAIIWTLRQNGQAISESRRSANIAEIQTRAYIGIDEARMNPIVAGSLLSARLIASNSGHSTAQDVETVWGIVGRIDGETEPFPDIDAIADAQEALSRAVVPRGGRFVINARKSVAVNDDTVAAVEARQVTLYVFGRIRYRDLFGEQHNTYFRYAHGGAHLLTDGALTMCDEGNRSD